MKLKLDSQSSLITRHGAIGQFNPAVATIQPSNNNFTLVLKGRSASVFSAKFSKNDVSCSSEIILGGGEKVRLCISAESIKINSDDIVDITLIGRIATNDLNISSQGVLWVKGSMSTENCSISCRAYKNDTLVSMNSGGLIDCFGIEGPLKVVGKTRITDPLKTIDTGIFEIEASDFKL
ncbi:MAG: hypothetical protein M3R00_02555 [Pseudomonadota bacterium]|nr:hypothetical protein [Pseudomonadota bacterium]